MLSCHSLCGVVMPFKHVAMDKKSPAYQPDLYFIGLIERLSDDLNIFYQINPLFIGKIPDFEQLCGTSRVRALH
ncbi:hypothetical protein GCM10009092_12100 [Bowmanella denitrificans]|uniref:Transposase n=1 Tax=Bowmanella denitrificans TaxID=366582 RepID=A0ABP3GM25_9ALTE